MSRGRPKKQVQSEVVTTNLDKYERRYINEDGSIDIWKFDIKKSINGPYETITEYPKGTKTFEQLQSELPKTKRKYLNTKNGKYVNYFRAKQLGIAK
jgi:hypothetical protein